MARSYVLGLLLLVAALAALTARRPRNGAAAALLVGLALTSAFGAALAVAVAVAVAVAAAAVAEGRRTDTPWPSRYISPRLIRTLVLALLLVTVEFVVVRCMEGDPSLLPQADLRRRADLASHGATALLPVPDSVESTWGRHVLDHLPGGVRLALLLAIAGGFSWALRGDPPAQALWTTAFVLCMLITLLTGASGLRHHGHLTLGLLATLWYARRPGAPLGGRQPLAVRGIGAAVVSAGLVAGVLATTADLRRPFSSAEAMADHLVTSLPADAPVVADTDFGTSGIAIMLG